MYFFKKGFAIFIGSVLLSLGINVFLAPYKILDGGIIGISLIVNYLFGLQAGLMMICFSIPIFIIAWIYYRDYFFNSLHGLLMSSLIIDLLHPFRSLVHTGAIYSAILGGILVGFGVGLMLRFHTSTGGTDLIAQFLTDKTGFNLGLLIFFMDSIVICLGGFLLSSSTLFLSIISIIVIGITTSFMTRNVKAI